MKVKKGIYIAFLLLIVSLQFYCSKTANKTSEADFKNVANTLNSKINVNNSLSLMTDSTFVEHNFANSLSIDPLLIKLIGFKTIDLTDIEVSEMKHLIEINNDIFLKKKNYFFSEKGKFLRVYFPLHTAIITLNDVEMTADEFGLVAINGSMSNIKLLLAGRKKSDLVRGTGSNIIMNDKIVLKKSLDFCRSNSNKNYYIFDLGKRSFGVNDSHNCCSNSKNVNITRVNSNYNTQSVNGITVADDETKVSCYQNHGNKNCSTAFAINEGRCTFKPTICMDYNGWFTDCGNGMLSNFPGSDCDYAMGAGHCWNEIM
jgi:hypothetical protein